MGRSLRMSPENLQFPRESTTPCLKMETHSLGTVFIFSAGMIKNEIFRTRSGLRPPCRARPAFFPRNEDLKRGRYSLLELVETSSMLPYELGEETALHNTNLYGRT